jgi:hypothetical protein
MPDSSKLVGRDHARNLSTAPDDLARAIAPHLAAILSILVSRPAANDDDLITVAEAVDHYKQARSALNRAIRDGELPAFGTHRRRTVRRADLERWIESRRVVHAPIEDDDIDRRMKAIRARKVVGR